VNDSQPLVTVIIPTIGRPKFMVEAVRSVLAQDYMNLQVLISDNAPSIPTRALLSEAGVVDDRIEILVQPERLPLTVHMDLLIRSARGTHLMILSDDDQITSGYVSEMVRLIQSDDAVTVCLGRQRQVTENDLGQIAVAPGPGEATIYDGFEFLAGSLSGKRRQPILTYISLFARKADLMAIGGFPQYTDGSHSDNFLLVALALRGKVAIGASLMLYRVYLSSSGLSTPFSSLLDATRAYMSDSRAALLQCSARSQAERSDIFRLIHRNNALTLFSRIRHVYARRSKMSSVVPVFKAIGFAMKPARLP
jgi:glycosyltransferase involved in cell wall biosynthesis